MVSLFGIFNVGSQSLGAQQRGLAVTADNIANVNTDGYSRQRVRLVTGEPTPTADGLYGGGVRLGGVDRLRDEGLEAQVRYQLASEGFYRQTRTGYDALQAILLDTLATAADDLANGAEVGLNQALIRFFDALDELSLAPESLPNRTVAIQEAQNLTETIRGIQGGLTSEAADLNRRIPALVDRVNSLAEQIAALNAQIAHLELGGLRTASTLRDERGRLLAELSELVPVRVVEAETGAVSVSVAGALLVSNDRVNAIQAVRRESDPFLSYDLVSTANPGRVLNADLDGGELGAIIQLRDEVIPSYLDGLNDLARALIQEANRVHSRSAGLVGFESVTAEQAASDTTVPLNAAGYPFAMTAGTLTLRVTSEAGDEIGVYSVTLDPTADSLEAVAARIDAADGTVGGGPLSAAVSPDGRLALSTADGYQLSFSGDSSGFLAALGINTLFSGTDAASVRVSDPVLADPRLLAVSATGAVGDNGGALALIALREAKVMNGGVASILDSYQAMIARLGTDARRAEEAETGASLLVDSLRVRQEEISGVSTDEEAVNLMRYQRAFEAAARLITTVDEMVATIIERTGLAGR